uniref:Small ribosomal subunit protein uS4c n=1 Tax=Chara vulgaris TaxID=55564 RepID=RR4_CHAVU|nr:ribosomal protein S4 [Chara vulgaris]Q1ACM7.1 RecName: Full=Small ribosomal subunit protein uS4c; AltName: Full=30S ribosomal protein S4, chloroplastic [Chara vulgaris]ABA61969.1 ribosomal protein S4 [Chara vulgaris]WAP91295.1 ribosomal protein S4 [Chara vulgaris]
MSRYRGPRLKIVRRLGPLPGFTQKLYKSKSQYLGSSTTSSSSNKKISQYNIRLLEKQKLRFYYGLTERQLLKYVTIARNAKGPTGQVLLQLLEMRLDNIVFRLGMAPTIPAARQLVNHRHILVNDFTVNIPSYSCKLGDKISVQKRFESKTNIFANSTQSASLKVPSHLTLNPAKNEGLVHQIVDREFIGAKINELLVVEYYSRQV